MPNYFYVKSGGTRGTADTPYTSLQTGSFPASTNCYTSIEEAFNVTTTPPTHGDFVLVSDAHSYSSYATNVNYLGPTGDGAGVLIISVDDTACNTYKAGATEDSSGGSYDVLFSGVLLVAGLNITVGDDVVYGGGTSCHQLFFQCGFTVAGSVDRPFSNAAANFIVTAVECTFNFNAASAGEILMNNEAHLRLFNCTFSTNASYAGAVVEFGNIKTCILDMHGCDMSALSSSYLFSVAAPGLVNAPRVVRVSNCKIPAITDWVDSTLYPQDQYLITNTASVSSEAEYQYLYLDGLGRVEDDSGIYRTASTAFPSGTKISLKVAATTNVSSVRPFIFDFPARYSALSSTSTDLITIYFMSATALDDGDIWAELTYPDGTNKHTPNFVRSVTNGFDPLRTAGSLSAGDTDWTGDAGTENYYKLELDTSGDAGADCVPIIRVYVAKPSTTIYFCPTIGLS